MAIDYDAAVRRAFKSVGRRNPLRELSNSDKQVLMALLHIYVAAPKAVEGLRRLEGAARVATDAAALAKRMRSELFEGSTAQMLAPLSASFHDLPTRLEEFSKIGTIVHSLIGKPGHTGVIARNQLLIMASEFVRLRTGKPYDEHLAELVQVASFDLGAEGETRKFPEMRFGKSESTSRRSTVSPTPTR